MISNNPIKLKLFLYTFIRLKYLTIDTKKYARMAAMALIYGLALPS